MAVGNVDGTGDGAMVAADVKALARRYCAEGVPVAYEEYPGASHIQAAAYFEPQTGPFLQARFAGIPFVSGC
jgi:acetyl esterase/lipase